jgi:hypothetical protein
MQVAVPGFKHKLSKKTGFPTWAHLRNSTGASKSGSNAPRRRLDTCCPCPGCLLIGWHRGAAGERAVGHVQAPGICSCRSPK